MIIESKMTSNMAYEVGIPDLEGEDVIIRTDTYVYHNSLFMGTTSYAPIEYIHIKLNEDSLTGEGLEIVQTYISGKEVKFVYINGIKVGEYHDN